MLEVWETSGIKVYGDDGAFHNTDVVEVHFVFDHVTVKVDYDDAKQIHDKLGSLLADVAKMKYRCP